MTALPTLSPALVRSGALAGRAGGVTAPPAELLDLPERAVQFGTGAFLRGFVDYFIDAANRDGRFNGRVVAVGSTGSGRDAVLREQGGLYTLAVQGVDAGEVRQERRIVSALSRAVSATDDWASVLELARRPELAIVFSNTTEVGIALDESDAAEMHPPRSFPGKLARFLYERATAFAFAPDAGVVVIPCELIEANGDRLREIVLALGARWKLGAEFDGWVRAHVPFCNTLVDRIVPGAPAPEVAAAMEHELGYRDGMLTSCEVYRLFAIHGGAALSAAQSRLLEELAGADPGIVLTDDVSPYRERKVRLLNGAHTIAVSLALLAGCETVREAMEHALVGQFIRRVTIDELVPSVGVPGAEQFALDVLDRFANPFIRHALVDITLQAAMKMRVRVVPSVVQYAAKTGRVPRLVALGFAAYLLYARGDAQEARRAAGLAVPADEQGEVLRALWRGVDATSDAALADLARRAVSDAGLWGAELEAVPGFAAAVGEHLGRLARVGALATLEAQLSTERA
jgi:tagaturonate reductase